MEQTVLTPPSPMARAQSFARHAIYPVFKRPARRLRQFGRWRKSPWVRLLRPLAFLSLLGPGLIAANAGNDAGAVATWASVGAQYGYQMLWVLVIITVSLAVVQEMCARMGAMTGKGLSDLIRERFGVRGAAFAMLTLLVANVLVTIAAVLAHPNWGDVARHTLIPTVYGSSTFLLLLVGTIGTTITPYMQLYISSSVAEKGVAIEDYRAERLETYGGSIFAAIIVASIVIATAATLYVSSHGAHQINDAKDMAIALEPFLGKYAPALFGVGLLGASLLAAAVLPLSTAYAVTDPFAF